ncbi:DNA cytosine methyltransferase [Acidovorax sp. SUPP950]|uniref:DNA cytosine methyltransferase n=1 Tax=Acidovorax sp. SUPP950 TaxID=511901 RepID=UPI0023D40E21|nr:DNA cytosine methyltransferase [Acidovorax sp. SUPP950]GKS73722.1 DNA cytosine methyltransferase [Acidovorax sp. SUPP950]
MLTPQFVLALSAKLVIDLFAGGGGASTGIEQAIGRHVDKAINHEADAIGMHEVNHPQTQHYRADIREVDPLVVTKGQSVGLLHASPDCTHHSQALGGQPRSEEIRSLAWVVHRWAGKTKPDVITLENVEQMLQWSPLVAKRDSATGRVITLDKVTDAAGKATYRVASPGEVVPRRNQFLVPDTKRKGRNWDHFVAGLRAMGYRVEWRVICNADLGAHSTRTRLYMVARCDGLPIVWPQQTHAKKPRAGLKAHRPAADCIDWSIPGTSIFGRKKDLAEATMRRIAHGMRKYVLDSPEPFIVNNMANNVPRPVSEPLSTALTGGHKMLLTPALVPVTHTRDTSFDVAKPLRTITTAKGGETALMAAHLVQMGYGERAGQAPRALNPQKPLGTITAGGQKFATAAAYLVQAGHGEGQGTSKRRSHGTNDITGPLGTVTASGGGQSVAAAFMVQANGGFNSTPARDLQESMSTVTTSGSQQQLIAAHLTTLRKHSTGRDAREPITTVPAGGEHQALVQYELSQEHEEGALRCAAFLMRYHASGGQWSDLRDPMTTITTHDRLALVTVWLQGEPWVIVDITLRMLVPRELYNAQDFPATYVIDRTAAGKPLTKTAQVRMAGNSVSPLPMRLIVAANYSDAQAAELRRAA